MSEELCNELIQTKILLEFRVFKQKNEFTLSEAIADIKGTEEA